MAMWVKLEKRKITAYKDGCIYKTKVIGYEWFESGKGLELYAIVDDHQYCATSDSPHFGPTKPTA